MINGQMTKSVKIQLFTNSPQKGILSVHPRTATLRNETVLMKSAFSEVLSSLRREKGLSQRRAAEDLGVSQALLSHYENDAREPKLEFVIKACNYYDVSADYILGRTNIRSQESKRQLKTINEDLLKLRNHNQIQADLLAKLLLEAAIK